MTGDVGMSDVILLENSASRLAGVRDELNRLGRTDYADEAGALMAKLANEAKLIRQRIFELTSQAFEEAL